MQAPRKCHRRRWALAPLSVAFLSPMAMGAAYLPGPGADPPTGDSSPATPSPAEPLQGKGIVWALAPWQVGGTLAVDLRALRLEDGSRSSGAVLVSDVDLASYVWQPWFVQVRLGLGGIASKNRTSVEGMAGLGQSYTARAAISVFPASRFPFELRADVGDSRSSGLSLGADHRSQRVSISQAYRPALGNDSYQLQLDRSELRDATGRDTLTTLNATGLQQFNRHTLDLGLNLSQNQRSRDGEHTALAALNARHSFQPGTGLHVESLASWNEVRLGSGAAQFGSDVRQISSFVSWRLPLGGAPAGARAPLVAATARWIESRNLGRDAAGRVQAVNASAGISHELNPDWRASLSGTASQLKTPVGTGGSTAGVQASLGWAPLGTAVAGWRYTPHASANVAESQDSRRGSRHLLGVQYAHGVTRELAFGEAARFSLGLSQSLGVLRDSSESTATRALAHGASLSWQNLQTDGGQTYGGISLNESRTQGPSRGRFQLVNLQWTQRTQVSRHATWSASVTAQGTRNESSEVDVFTGQLRELKSGWQHFYNGTLSYEHQRAFGVPRLRHSVLLGATSQVLESRALGDIDAPRERISETLETRLDYAIGRLDTRLSARVARIDGRWVSALQARAQRRF